MQLSAFNLHGIGLGCSRDVDGADDRIGATGQSGVARTRPADHGGEERLPARDGRRAGAKRAAIKEANALDMEVGAKLGLSSAMLDRLKLDDKRIAAMAKGLREVAALPDPVGRILDERVRPNGLKLQKITTPIGVVVIIYESRPNVTADAASLCFKSGNATILRGGKEALNSNQIIARIMIEAGRSDASRNFPSTPSRSCPTTDREAIPELLFAHAIRGFVHAARRREADPRRDRVLARCRSSNITRASATSLWMPTPI